MYVIIHPWMCRGETVHFYRAFKNKPNELRHNPDPLYTINCHTEDKVIEWHVLSFTDSTVYDLWEDYDGWYCHGDLSFEDSLELEFEDKFGKIPLCGCCDGTGKSDNGLCCPACGGSKISGT